VPLPAVVVYDLLCRQIVSCINTNLDGGIGVAAGLRDHWELEEAITSVSTKSTTWLVEKHVEGRDYRLTVFQGEIIWAIERIPGSVTGDGQHTVTELVTALNQSASRQGTRHLKSTQRQNGSLCQLKPINLAAFSNLLNPVDHRKTGDQSLAR